MSSPTNPSEPTPFVRPDPALLAAARDQVLDFMRRRHTIADTTAWTLLLGGGLVLIALGCLLSFFMMLLHASIAGWYEAFSVGTFFAGYLVLMSIWLVYFARSTRAGFFSFASTDVDLTRDPDNTAEYLIRRTRTHAATFVEYLMWAPRAFIAGLRGIRGKPQEGLERILPEAADTLTLMLSIDSGVKIADLALPGEDPLMLMPTLKWLDTHDYIGFSTRGDRVWVSSIAKKRLVEEGIIVPKANAKITPANQSRGAADSDGPIELA